VRGHALWRDAGARQQGHLTLVVLALALAPTALGAVRNVPPFLMLAVPAVAALVPRREGAAATRSERPRLNAAIAGIAAAVAVTSVAVAYALPADRLGWRPLPAASLGKLAACRGNLYNRYDEGGYLIWFAPDHKVFLDGRQDPYPPSLIAAQVRAETTGDYRPLFERYEVGCAYVPSDALVTRRLIAAGWTPLYRDARWAVLAP
jgi:hypothetical protein